jgi:hypothetical protein
MKLSYVIPIRRNSKLIDYSLQQESFFMFEGRPIFYSMRSIGGGRTIYTFRNDFLKAEEERDYLGRYSKADNRSRKRM